MPLDKTDPQVRAINAIGEMMFQHIEHMKDHPMGKGVQAEVSRLHSGAAALANVRANRSPLDTPAAHALKVAKLARKYQQEATASINRTAEHLRAAAADIDKRIAGKVDLTPNAFAQEIRTAYRTMKPKERADLIKALVEENRGPEMAAIVKAPSMLTGISDKERETYESMIVNRHAGDEVREREHVEELFNSVVSAYQTASNLAKRFTNPDELAQIERAVAEADAAGAAFDQSVG